MALVEFESDTEFAWIRLNREDKRNAMNQQARRAPGGVRDRAMLEVLYSTGVRRSELCGLARQDVTVSRRTLLVRHGKGDKDRLLPIGRRALYWLERYLSIVRPELLLDVKEPALFLND